MNNMHCILYILYILYIVCLFVQLSCTIYTVYIYIYIYDVMSINHSVTFPTYDIKALTVDVIYLQGVTLITHIETSLDRMIYPHQRMTQHRHL